MSRFRKAFLVWLVIIVPLVAALTIIGMTYYPPATGTRARLARWHLRRTDQR